MFQALVRSPLRIVFWSAVAAISFTALWADSTPSDQSDSKVAKLADQLEKGLRARRSVEFQFLGRVAQLVEAGQLPRDLVQSTYGWTLSKYRNRKTLVPYFELALRHRAAQAENTALDDVVSTIPKSE